MAQRPTPQATPPALEGIVDEPFWAKVGFGRAPGNLQHYWVNGHTLCRADEDPRRGGPPARMRYRKVLRNAACARCTAQLVEVPA